MAAHAFLTEANMGVLVQAPAPAMTLLCRLHERDLESTAFHSRCCLQSGACSCTKDAIRHSPYGGAVALAHCRRTESTP